MWMACSISLAVIITMVRLTLDIVQWTMSSFIDLINLAIFLHTGPSYTSSVFSWDSVAEEWILAGRLSFARGYHAVAEVPLRSFCSQ